MTPDEAAWVRGRAWVPGMRSALPEIVDRCACQRGPSPDCEHGQHDRCRRSGPLPKVETYVKDSRGGVVHFGQRYEHATPTALGPSRTNAVQVWLSDRVCLWACACPDRCHGDGSSQLALFGGAA